jgi:hypothetical protein
MTRSSAALLLTALSAAPALAQLSAVDPTNKFSWSENCGWMNWRDAGSPAGSQGVRRTVSYLAGYIWAENVGWVTVGDGTPANSTVYSNASGSDAGVNIDAGTGNLSGYAWGENIGWINFAAAAPLGPAFAARIDPASSRLRGWAWGENIGWIDLDDAAHYVSFGCYANCDGSTTTPLLNVNDFVCFQSRFAAADPYADCDQSGTLNVNDFVCFQSRFAAGCP